MTLTNSRGGMIYPKEDPHWVQATRVESGFFANEVHVWALGKDYGTQKVGWSSPVHDTSTSDCLIEDPELGWLKIWWYDDEVQ